ncbi:MAG: hypothetical protein ACTSQY_09625 [Candidatus Odinarchaeia archaeon]
MKMVWKKVRKISKEEEEHISKRAIKKKFSPLFAKAKTRKSCDIDKTIANSKMTITKTVK